MLSDALNRFLLRPEEHWPVFLGSLWITLGLWLVSSLWPYAAASPWRRWNHPVVYGALLLLALAAFRWPAIGTPGEFNPDESQLLAGGITLLQRGGFWRIDLGTSGPLAYAPLALPGLLGWPVDYAGGRCLALLMTWGSIVFVWLGLRHLLTDHLARVLVLPMGCLLVGTTCDEFVMYSSEHPPLLCLSAAFWLLVTAFDPAGLVAGRGRLFGGGFLLGLLPFTKLQAAPLGVILGLGAVVWILRQPGRPGPPRWRDLRWLLAGVFLAAGLLLGGIALDGSLGHFYRSYLEMNVIYAGARAYPWSGFARQLWLMAGEAPGFRLYLWPSWALLLLALPFCGQVAAPLRRPLVLGGVLLLGGYFVVGAPGRPSPHYLQFLVPPTTIFLAVLYGGLLLRPGWPGWRRALWYVPVLGLGVGLQVAACYANPSRPHFGDFHESRSRPVRPVVRLLQPHIRPGDTLSVWGWACAYHVQTQLPQATREAHTERQLSPGALREYYRRRYFADLQENRPVFFLDAVGPAGFGFTVREHDGHENFPALGEFIAAHYRLVGDLESTRLYLRLDRWAETGTP